MKKYLANRLIVITVILFLFILHGLLFIENDKSCIGNPKILPTMFIGFPLILLLLVTDSLIIFFKKEKRKYIVYPFIYYFMTLLLTIFFFRD